LIEFAAARLGRPTASLDLVKVELIDPRRWTVRRYWANIRSSHVERDHGCRRVASQSRPRSIRSKFSRQQDQRFRGHTAASASLGAT